MISDNIMAILKEKQEGPLLNELVDQYLKIFQQKYCIEMR